MKKDRDRGLYRGLYSALFDDPHQYQQLSKDARLLLLTLRGCKDAGVACIFRYYVDTLRDQTGMTAEEIDRALSELATSPTADRPWLMLDRTARVVWIRNGLRFDPGISLAHPRQFIGVWRAVCALPATHLVPKFCRYYGITKARVKAMGEASAGPAAAAAPPTRARSDSDSDSEKEKKKEPPPTSPRAAEATRPDPGHRDQDGELIGVRGGPPTRVGRVLPVVVPGPGSESEWEDRER